MHPIHRCVFMLAIIIFSFGQAVAESEEAIPLNGVRPLWEAGIGGFAGSVPDYPAAGQNTFRALALPYLIYRGDILRVGGEENRGAISDFTLDL